MKKSLVALAVLAASGASFAQSSVTLFGVVDATVQQIKGNGNGSVTRLTNSGYNSSRLGFRGTEDLGGGMNASFWLEAGLGNDDGTMAGSSANNQGIAAFNATTGANAPVRSGTQGLTFNRRSTVSLGGGFGEVRLGRDYVPAFWNHTVFDPFGTNGVGSGSNLSLALATVTNGTAAAPVAGVVTSVRASNSIGYFLPGNLGGIYGQAMYAFGENASTAANKNDGKHTGFRVGYANGPINVALGYGVTKLLAFGDYKNTNIGGSYDLGVAKLSAIWNQEKLGAAAAAPLTGAKHTTYLLGVNAPVGAGEIRASYVAGKATATGVSTLVKGSQISLGYVHNLSKRTALYTTYSKISNNDSAAATIYNNGRAGTGAGADTSGFDVGVRHSF